MTFGRGHISVSASLLLAISIYFLPLCIGILMWFFGSALVVKRANNLTETSQKRIMCEMLCRCFLCHDSAKLRCLRASKNNRELVMC